jgi:hypothetical protein
MYPYFLFFHSWLRWFVLILLVILLLKFLFSLIKKSSYSSLDRILSSALLGVVHLQFLVGLILYFALSPIVQMGLSNMSQAMKNRTLRYWTVEHFSAMFLFTLLIQIGFSVSKRAPVSTKKHRVMFVFSTIAFLILMLSIPWPVKEYGRVLFRLY